MEERRKLGYYKDTKIMYNIFMNDMELHHKVQTHTYIDHIVLTESISATNKGHLQGAVHSIKALSDNNNMSLNERKIKKMLISFKQNAVETKSLLLTNKAIERVTHLKIPARCGYDCHTAQKYVHHMAFRASPKLYYIRQLKRSGLTRDDILVYYIIMIQPILEYACPVWQAGLSSGESGLLE